MTSDEFATASRMCEDSMDGEFTLPEITLPLDLQNFFAWLLIATVVSAILAKVIGRRRAIVEPMGEAPPQLESPLVAEYRMIERLGRGASSDVWLAEQLATSRQVAVKVLRADEDNPGSLARFVREAAVAALVSSPHAPRFVEQCQSSAGDRYLVYDLAKGESLAQLLHRYGAMPEGLVVEVLRQLSSYLRSLHQLGWIHGDLQPSNLLLSQDDDRGTFLMVVDLGLARLIEDNAVNQCEAATVSGVPEYMSPEATRRAEQLTATSDIYALGCLGYAMVSGHPPIEGNNPLETCSKQRTQQPVALKEVVPEIDDQLSELIMCCLAKSPDNRPENCQVLERQLETIAHRVPWTPSESAAWWLCTEML